MGFFRAIWETIKGVLVNPIQTFAEMRTEGGIGTPILYAIILGSIGGVIGIIWQGLMSTLDFMVNQEIAKYAVNAVYLVLIVMVSNMLNPIFFTAETQRTQRRQRVKTEIYLLRLNFLL